MVRRLALLLMLAVLVSSCKQGGRRASADAGYDVDPAGIVILHPNGGEDVTTDSSESVTVSGTCTRAPVKLIASPSANLVNNCAKDGTWSFETGKLYAGRNTISVSGVLLSEALSADEADGLLHINEGESFDINVISELRVMASRSTISTGQTASVRFALYDALGAEVWINPIFTWARSVAWSVDPTNILSLSSGAGDLITVEGLAGGVATVQATLTMDEYLGNTTSTIDMTVIGDPPVPDGLVEVVNLWGKTGFMDQVKLADQDQDCVASEASNAGDCFVTRGAWLVEIPSIASCTGLSIVEDLDLFEWKCDDRDGWAKFLSSIKETTTLADFLVPGAFKQNKVTVYNDVAEVVAYSELSTWFTDTVSELPVSTAGTDPIYINQAGIYTYGPAVDPIMTNSFILTAEKTAVVGLGDAQLKFNDGCINAGYPEPVCFLLNITRNYSYIEGKFVSPPAEPDRRNYALVTSGTNLGDPATHARFLNFRDVEIIKNPAGINWGGNDEPEGLIMMGACHTIEGTFTATGLTGIDMSSLGVTGTYITAEVTVQASYKPGISIQNGSGNSFLGDINISGTGTKAGLYLDVDATGNFFSGNVNVDGTDKGILIEGDSNTFAGSQITITDVPNGAGIEINSDDNTIGSNIVVSGSQKGIQLYTASGNEFVGNITMTNLDTKAISLSDGSGSNVFYGAVDISSISTNGGGYCIEVSDRTDWGGEGSPSNTNWFQGTLSCVSGYDGIHIWNSSFNMFDEQATFQDLKFGVYIAGDSQSNSIPSVKINGGIITHDLFMSSLDGKIPPANNTVTSYDSSTFNSCAEASVIVNNTTSCP